MKSPGDRVDRYQIEKLLGSGGMGAVYEALDTRLGRKIALKLVHDNTDEAVARMLREAQTAAQLDHPHAVTVYDAGQHDGEVYLAMELVRGTPLRALIGDASITLDRKLRWLADIAAALAAAHRAGLVHRDVKPDNVMLRSDGVIKVLDFGIAKRQPAPVDPSAPTIGGDGSDPAIATLTEAGTVVGTPRYAAPEQLRGDPVDGRADQFSWAMTAYELLTGHHPFAHHDGVALISQILTQDPSPLSELVPELPKEATDAIERAMSKSPDARYDSMDDIAIALEPFAEATGHTTDRTSLRAAAPKLPSKAPVPIRAAKAAGRVFFYVAAAIGSLLILAIVAGAFMGKLNIDLGPDEETVEVDAIRCQEAIVEGEGNRSGLPIALGIGACARLGAHLGVDWRQDDAEHRLDVHVKLGDPVVATLTLGAAKGEGEGETPLEAITHAVTALADEVAPAPMSEAEVQSWGAENEADARAIRRHWNELVLSVSDGSYDALGELETQVPSSPWPPTIRALISMSGSEARIQATQRALDKLDKLPESRALGLRGALLFLKSEEDRPEALRLLRESYRKNPNDPDIAGLYGAIAIELAPEEGFAVVDRLSEQFPTRSIVPLTNAMGEGLDPDLERDQRYAERLWEVFPESKSWQTSVEHFMRRREFDEARTAIQFGRRLGSFGPASDRSRHDFAAGLLELADLWPVRAYELSKQMLADPRPNVTAGGAQLTIAALVMQGRLSDAERARESELVRQRDDKNPLLAVRYALEDLKLARRLAHEDRVQERIDYVTAVFEKHEELTPTTRARARVELALARMAGRASDDATRIAEETLAGIDALATEAFPHDARRRNGILATAVPLLAAVKGAEAAAERWHQTRSAPHAVRCAVAFDAALALEAVGNDREAIEAYELAREPDLAIAHPFDYAAAHHKLASLYRSTEQPELADALDALAARAFAKADFDVAKAIGALR